MDLRLSIIRLIFFSLFFLVTIRLGYWQLAKAQDLSSSARGQHLKSSTVSANRGEILFSDDYPIVTNQIKYKAFINPQIFKPSFSEANNLLKVLDSTESARLLEASTQSTHLSWFLLASDITESKKNLLESLNLSGLGFEEFSSRFYPEGSSSAQLVGFLGRTDLGEPKGFFGLEGFYNRELTGKNGQLIEELDALSHPILIGSQSFIPAQPGRNLKTSIDRVVQFIAFQKLAEGIQKYQADSGTVTIMDPYSGQIIA
jgi:cell division protein FtsI/penicillin-binding protein 2